MASLYKPKYKVIDPETGEPVERVSKKWYGRYRDEHGTMRRVALAGNKQVAQAMLQQTVTRVERMKAGLIDPVEIEAERPMREHLDDYMKHMKQKDDTPRHIRDTRSQLKKMIKAGKWHSTLEIRATDVQAYLGDLADKGNSIRTRNSYLAAAKAFTKWLHRNRRLSSDVLIHLSPSNTEVDRRRDRRPLAQEEFALLIDAAEHGPPIQSIPGPDRAMMYLLAAYTGLRKGEIGSLTVASFDLKNNPASTVTVAGYSKRRRKDTQVLHPTIATRFHKWLKQRKPAAGEILFPVDKRTCGTDRRTAKMMAEDLEAARRKWLAEANGDAPEREKTDFLKYVDSQNRYADFHSNRHTFITNLSLAGVQPRDAQELARHSDIRLTMNLYTHIGLEDKAKAIGKLAGLEEGGLSS